MKIPAGRRIAAVALAFIVILSISNSASAFTDNGLSKAVSDSASYIYNTVRQPQVGSIGGEWAVLGLARSGYPVPEKYFQDYYATVEEYVTACKGVLHQVKYTEYSRVVVSLTSIGKDPRNVAGYDLLKPLADYDKTIWQGLNGPIWALIALDSGNYDMPVNREAKTQATRRMYIDRILECQLPDGGWSLFGGTELAAEGDMVSDPDITGMALQALAKYQYQPDVKAATEEALACMSLKQDKWGGFSSWGTANSESCAQILVALCELGIPVDDGRFVKSGYTVLDRLLSFRNPDGSFLHTASGSGSNQMASEQGLYGLAAALRAQDGLSSLYRMSDALSIGVSTGPAKGSGLEGRNTDVRAVPLQYPGISFPDVTGEYAHVNQPAIEALTARGILGGKDDGKFHPDAPMTRAEFASAIVRALGLRPEATDKFADVRAGQWFASYIGAADSYGIVNGATATTFSPDSMITRQEAAAMVARAAALCGMDTSMSAGEVRDMLAQFDDYVTSYSWARPSLAFCYREGFLDQSELLIRPLEAIKRCEIAQMIFDMLGKANLI